MYLSSFSSNTRGQNSNKPKKQLGGRRDFACHQIMQSLRRAHHLMRLCKGFFTVPFFKLAFNTVGDQRCGMFLALSHVCVPMSPTMSQCPRLSHIANTRDLRCATRFLSQKRYLDSNVAVRFVSIGLCFVVFVLFCLHQNIAKRLVLEQQLMFKRLSGHMGKIGQLKHPCCRCHTADAVQPKRLIINPKTRTQHTTCSRVGDVFKVGKRDLSSQLEERVSQSHVAQNTKRNDKNVLKPS